MTAKYTVEGLPGEWTEYHGRLTTFGDICLRWGDHELVTSKHKVTKIVQYREPTVADIGKQVGVYYLADDKWKQRTMVGWHMNRPIYVDPHGFYWSREISQTRISTEEP